MSAPPGLERTGIKRYSCHELRHLAATARDLPCPEQLQCYGHLKGKRDFDTWNSKPKAKKQDRTDWRSEGGARTEGRTEGRQEPRRDRSNANSGAVKLENLKKIELPFGSKEDKEKKSDRSSRGGGNHSGGGWDDVEAGGGWTGASSGSRAASGGRMSAAEKMKQFERERQEILMQRTGGTPSAGGGHHLEQHAAGEEGSYHTEADSLMAALQAEAGQVVSPPPASLDQPAAAIISATTIDISAAIWSPPPASAAAGADIFSSDFFSSSTPLGSAPLLPGEEDSGVKHSTRLKSWLSTLSGEDEETAAAPVSTEERKSKSRMNFVTSSPEVSRSAPPPDIPAASLPPVLPPSQDMATPASPQKSTKLSLNSLFSMAAKSPGKSRDAGEPVTQAADVMAKLGFSDQGSPPRHPNDPPPPPVANIAASLGPSSPLPNAPKSPFSFPIHHYAPPGTTPDPAAASTSSGLSAGGLSTPVAAKTASAGQPRSGGKGMNMSASSRLLIQQQKNKRQQLQKQQGGTTVAPTAAPAVSAATDGVSIKFGDVNADVLIAKKSENGNGNSNAEPSTTTKSGNIGSAVHNGSVSQAKNPKMSDSSKDKSVKNVPAKTVQKSAQNDAPSAQSIPAAAPVASVSGMKKISVNALFARAPVAKPASA